MFGFTVTRVQGEIINRVDVLFVAIMNDWGVFMPQFRQITPEE